MGHRPRLSGARSSWYSQTLREVLVLEAQGALGVLGVLLVRGLLPSRPLQEHPWGRGLPCFPAQVERECHHSGPSGWVSAEP